VWEIANNVRPVFKAATANDNPGAAVGNQPKPEPGVAA